MSASTPLSPPDGLILIVNYNQAEEIETFLSEVKRHCSQDRCVVVDDGSTDGSREIAERMGFRVLAHPRNIGVGAAIRTGLEHGMKDGYRWVLVTASSGKMRPDEFERVYGPVESREADYVQGNRFLRPGSHPGLSPFRRATIPIFSLFASILLGRKFTDVTCGLRCYTFDLVRDPAIDLSQDWLSRYELEYYLHYKVVVAKKYRVVEVPITMQYHLLARTRQSHIRPLTGWWSMMRPFLLLATRLKK